MSNKKKILIVISILAIYLIIMIALFGVDQVKNKWYYVDILMEPYTYWHYENGYWKNEEKNPDSMLGKSYKVYGDHKFLYDGILQYNFEKWYAFDQNNQPLTLKDNFFAYRGNMNIEVLDFEIQEMSNSEKIEAKGLLKEQDIQFEPVYTKQNKIELDLNNDGKKETIYIISNTLGTEDQETYFSIAYIKENGKKEILINDISKDMYSVAALNIKEIIDINKDKKYELIFEKIYFDQIGTCHTLFEYEKNMYHSAKDCDILKRGDEES